MTDDTQNTDLDAEAVEQARAPLPDEHAEQAQQVAPEWQDDDTAAAAGGDEDAEMAADGDDDATADGRPRTKRKGRVQKRIGDLTRRARDAERDADYWRGVAQGRVADTDYGVSDDQRMEEAAALAQAQVFAQRVDAARHRFDDFDAVAFAEDLPVSDVMAAVIQASEHGPDIAYHLGSHPHDAARIAALDPLSAANELGRIEAGLAMPAPRRTTSAPYPVSTVGSGGEAPMPNLDSLPMEEYTALRQSGKLR